MATTMLHNPCPFPLNKTLVFLFYVVVLPFHSFSQSDSPQNIETFFPIDKLSPVPPPRVSPSTNPSPSSNNSSSDKATIIKAILITAASTVVVAAAFFFFLNKCIIARRKQRNRVGVENTLPPFPPPPMTVASTTTLDREGFTRFGGVKGLILDEDGLDVLYWRKLQSRRESNESFKKEIIAGEDEKEVIYYKNKKRSEPVTEIPLLRGRSSTSHSVIHNHRKPPPEKLDSFEFDTPPPSPPSPPSPPPPPPPPPPPIPMKQSTPTPPPQKGPSPSPPPPPPVKKVGALSSSSSKPPPAPPRGGESSRNGGQVKLKPLHWDKVNPDSDHSMVWDKIDHGSFSFDGNLMEALFGVVALGKKSPEHGDDDDNKNPKSASSQIFILDPRKSQNTAIVLKSLGMTSEELVEALMEGNEFVQDTLERLARIAPTKEEQSAILEFDGDVTKLADAETFLFHLLKSVPTAFTRLNAFLFKANYYPELVHHRKCLQTFDSACKELRSRGLFVKLLEAILKAGNRMNAGTARGNAQAFNLNALLKLSDVKSMDGKTTLLNFVVEEVVRSEGKRCVLNRRSHSLTRSNNDGNTTSKEDEEKDFLKLGLPIVGGLSSEFSNVKKAACIDYDTFASTCSVLAVRAKDSRTMIGECEDGEGGRFVKKMMTFLDSVQEEVRMAKEEEMKVMELVKRTTDYYQAGVVTTKGKNHPLHLFVIVRDFLGMVDKVCLEIMRNLQRRKVGSSVVSPSSQRTAVKFPVLPPNFMSDRSRSDSGESDSDM